MRRPSILKTKGEMGFKIFPAYYLWRPGQISDWTMIKCLWFSFIQTHTQIIISDVVTLPVI